MWKMSEILDIFEKVENIIQFNILLNLLNLNYIVMERKAIFWIAPFWKHSKSLLETVADLRGRRGRAPPPGGHNFFIFMQFSAEIDKIIGWRPPPPGVGAPSSGKSWIRHWETIANSFRRHGVEFDCNQETILVLGARPLIDFN